jgi:hypothetical protein
VVALGAGCSDYKLNELDAPDTAEPSDPDPGTVEESECKSFPSAGQVSSPGLGWTDSAACNAYNGVYPGTPGTSTLTHFGVTGTGTSPTPPAYLRIVALDGSLAAYPNEGNFRSENTLTATESGGDWSLTSAFLGNLNSCFPDCDWQQVVVELQDPTRTAASTCGAYVPDVELCLYWQHAVATRSEPVEVSCEAGAGRFRLVPRRLVNYDADSRFSVILSPIQVSGTGHMTGAAWITDLDVVEDQGVALRIMKPSPGFRFDSGDQLVDQSINSMALSPTNSWLEGTVSGGAPVVGVELLGTTTADFEVDLEWTCGTVPVQGERHPSQGYLVKPASLDCTGAWKQWFTVRPVPYLAPKYLHLERYGHVEDRQTIRLSPATGGGWNFDHKRGDFRLKGKLASYSSTGASLVLDEVSIAGIDVCDAGTYTLGPEE